FEVDTRSGELRRRGSRVDLQEQPFQVLVQLLERPGEVVTRDEFTKRLWSENTFVDFDRGLNKAINRLRVALRGDAEKPRFIETLPQRGYRFIAPVESSELDSPSVVRVRSRPVPQPAPRIDSPATAAADSALEKIPRAARRSASILVLAGA